MSTEYPKIYFGRPPKEFHYDLDEIFKPYFVNHNFNFESAVEAMIADLTPGVRYHTLNPLIPNYLEDAHASELFWLIDSKGNYIHMLTDESMQKKLEIMGPGDVLCDDARSFFDNKSIEWKDG